MWIGWEKSATAQLPKKQWINVSSYDWQHEYESQLLLKPWFNFSCSFSCADWKRASSASNSWTNDCGRFNSSWYSRQSHLGCRMVHGGSQVWMLKLAFKNLIMSRVKMLGLFSKYMHFYHKRLQMWEGLHFNIWHSSKYAIIYALSCPA